MPGTIPRPYDLKSQGKPSVGADAIDVLIWQNLCFGATIDAQTVPATQRGGAILLNPTGSGLTTFIYGIQISVGATAVVRLGYVNVTTNYTQSTNIFPKHSGAGQTFATASSTAWFNVNAGANASFFKSLTVNAGASPFQLYPPTGNVVLRPNSGLLVTCENPTTFSVSFDFVEYKVT